MAKTPATRRYRKRRRAHQEQETRTRITEAVLELHRTVGPAHTTITDVADRAGVSRMTVYSHFPTEADLIEACSTHWGERNPFPALEEWAGIEDPRDRLLRALSDLYRWYGEKVDMMGKVLRDAPVVEPLGAILAERWEPYLEAVVTVLADGRSAAAPGGIEAALRVAVDFGTWRTLTERTGTGNASRLAAAMVEGVQRADARGGRARASGPG